jgi:hypothetical protein
MQAAIGFLGFIKKGALLFYVHACVGVLAKSCCERLVQMGS